MNFREIIYILFEPPAAAWRIVMTRREAREAVLELLYEKASRPDDDAAEIYENAAEIRETEENDYIKEVYFGVNENLDAIDEKIKTASLDWSTERMSRVTISVLRLAVYEFYFIRNIPVNVSINEAVELAKKYDTTGAPSFINGILSKIGKDTAIEKDAYPKKNRK